jgi:Ala-tRNA(Pro) deacylase
MWIKNMLRKRGVPYEEYTHREAFTAQQLAQVEHMSGHRVAKVVIAMADGLPVELILPATRRVDLDKLRTVLGAFAIRLATETEMEDFFPGCEPGAIPPLDHWPGVPVVMDASMRVAGTILFQAGTHQDAILAHFLDWFDAVKPRVADFTEPYTMPELVEV